LQTTDIVFKSIRVKRNFEEVSDEIKELIFKGALKQGDRLPSENKLSSQFGVGRQTIREALRVLELSGFITIKRGGRGGPVISETITDKMYNLFLDAIKMKVITIDEVTLARLEIEKMILNHVFSAGTEEDFKALQDNIATANKKIEGNNFAFGENTEFHNLLARASHNQMFIIIMETIMAVVSDFLSRLKPSLRESRAIVKDHEEILDAILNKRMAESTILIEKHLLKIQTKLQANCEKLYTTKR
jgi:GntR family transcriptional regulator, transcriptional repressor for pyruvate dehydrogenase complex